MSGITPKTPPVVFGYWRPWDENSHLCDSYLDYVKDVSLAKYSADTVGQYIGLANQVQVKAIGELGQKVGLGMNILYDHINAVSNQLNELTNQMAGINEELSFVNRNLVIQIEQQKITNLLLEDISELLRVPDSEKERQHSIELGLKFFINARKDDDLFADALEELLKAEELMKQDYFVLHRIGLIYMYSVKHINPQKALDYFARAAKYASVESDPDAVRLANILTQSGKRVNTEASNDTEVIESLAADSYDKAAFAAYVSGDFESAVKYQTRAVKYCSSSENYFMLAKYQTRTKEIDLCVQNISRCINDWPEMLLAVFKDLDLVNEPEVLKVIKEKNDDIDQKILQLIKKCEMIRSDTAKEIITELKELSKAPYNIKIEKYFTLSKDTSDEESSIMLLKEDILQLQEDFKNTIVLLTDAEINTLIQFLDDCIDKSFEEMVEAYEKCREEFNLHRLQIGSKYGGGIVFHLDESGEHGLVVAETDQATEVFWGILSKLDTKKEIGTGKSNTKLIVEKASSIHGFFSDKPFMTAARICDELSLNGFNDWFLPSFNELGLLSTNIKKYKLSNVFGHLDSGLSKFYWSSSEDYYATNASGFILPIGGSTIRFKYYDGYTPNIFPQRVRAVRAF